MIPSPEARSRPSSTTMPPGNGQLVNLSGGLGARRGHRLLVHDAASADGAGRPGVSPFTCLFGTCTSRYIFGTTSEDHGTHSASWPTPGGRSARLRAIGLDQCDFLLAPCLLGYAGTAWQNPAFTSLCLAGLRYSSARRTISVTRGRVSVRENSGLLIRGFGVQVPGGAPVLSSEYSSLLIFFSEPVRPWWVQCGTRTGGATGFDFVLLTCGRPGYRAGSAFSRASGLFGQVGPRASHPRVPGSLVVRQ